MIRAQYKCGCVEGTSASCMVSCAKCGERGLSLDTLLVRTRPGACARLAGNAHDGAEMQARERTALGEMPPTVRRKRGLVEVNKRRLERLVPGAGSQFQTHLQQAALVDSAGLGGAAASPAVRLAEGAAAVLQDGGASRAVARTLGAFVAESTKFGAGGSSAPPPGQLGAMDVSALRQTVMDAIDAALSKRPQYSPGTRAAMRRVSREVGLAAASTRDAGEVAGSANPYFSVTATQLKRAAMRYIQILEGFVSP